MNKLVTVVADLRIHTLLCCSAAVLLTACGGGLSENGSASKAPQVQASITQSDQPVATLGAAGANDAAAPAASTTADAATPAAPATDSAATLTGSTPHLLAMTQSFTVDPATTSIYNLYVSTTGSDSNAGSATYPFRTIGRAAKAAKPSTTIHVAAGTYRENVTSSVSGTSTARIRFQSDTKWGAKVIGSGTEAMWTNNASYTDIAGFDISGSGRLGIVNWGSYTLVTGNHIHNLTISGGCTGSGGAGVVNANYSGSDGDTIGNVVHDIGVPGACNGVQGIYSSNLRGKLMNNIVYRVSSYGIHLWHAATNVLIANNTVFANGSSGMGGGIVVGTGDSPGGVVLNYTRVINNIVYRNPSSGIKQYCYSGQACIGTTNTTANNLTYGNGTNIIMRVGSATGTVVAEPKFVNYQANGTGNYRLSSTSPAVDHGTSTAAPTYDIDFIARPRGVTVDIGAYESY